MIRYLVVDQDGQLRDRTAADYRKALADCGPEGWDHAWLYPGGRLTAFVNDCGHILPDRYRRNVVGGCLLVSTAAKHYPYAGPVVFTGWDPDETEDIEIRSLTDEQATALRMMWADIRVVLGLDAGELSDLATERWRVAIKRYAEFAAAAPAPGMQFLADDEALAFLRGAR